MKKQGPCTVAYLSRQLNITPNAVRQHLSSLERDKLVTQQPLKTGPNRPALAFSLTTSADSYFPKRYETLLSGLLQELAHRAGKAGVCDLLSQLGNSAAACYADQLDQANAEEKLRAVERIMSATGSIPDWVEADGVLTLRDFNCPYSAVAREHPEVCEVQRSFLQRLLHPASVAIACDHQKSFCQFQVRLQ